MEYSALLLLLGVLGLADVTATLFVHCKHVLSHQIRNCSNTSNERFVSSHRMLEY
jgi:hypothetical protein